MEHNESFIELADRILTLDKVILSQWEKLVRDSLDFRKKESHIILQDHMPEILKNLALALKRGLRDDMQLARAHGFQRAILTKYTIDDLMMEYAIFRETLIIYLYPIGDLECVKFMHWYLDCLSRHSVLEFLRFQKVSSRVIVPPSEGTLSSAV